MQSCAQVRPRFLKGGNAVMETVEGAPGWAWALEEEEKREVRRRRIGGRWRRFWRVFSRMVFGLRATRLLVLD